MTDNPPQTDGTFFWYELGTKDVSKAKAFYGGLFGWQMTDTEMPGDMPTYTTFMAGEHPVGGMFEMQGEHFEGMPSYWGSYLSWTDVDGAAKKAAASGGNVMSEPFDIPNVGRMAAIQDPSGAVVMLMKADDGGSMAGMGMEPGRVGWTELMTSDADAAKAFYADVLGWEYQDDPMATGSTYTTVKIGDAPVGGLFPMDDEQKGQMPSHWMPYFNVTSCDECVAKAQELGGQVAVPPQEMAGVGKFAVLSDPTGAAFSVIRFEVPG